MFQAASEVVSIDPASLSDSCKEGPQRRLLRFPEADTPFRVLGHPTDHEVFFTFHGNHVKVWNCCLLGGPSDSPMAILGHGGSSLRLDPGCGRLLDAAVSPDGRIVFALTEDGSVTAWRCPSSQFFEVGEPLQRLELHSGSQLSSIRALGCRCEVLA